MSSPVRAAIFDLDGTLVDAFADITAAVNVPLVRRGVKPHPVSAVMRWVGEGAGVLIERATPPEFLDEIDAIHEEMLHYYTAHSSDLAALYPGVEEVLAGLRAAGVRIGVLTNKPHQAALNTCEHMGLMRYVDDVQGQCDINSPRKPDPRSLLAQIARLGAERAVMVGDGIPDGEVSLRAGVPFIACLWGTKNCEELTPYNPVAFAEHPMDLARLIPQALDGFSH